MTEINRLDWSLIPDDVPREMVIDFRNHMYMCFKCLGLGEPTPYQYAMGEALQNWSRDMQLQAGRGGGKSTITAMLASWFLLRDPNANVMVVSASQAKAIEFCSQVKAILKLVPYCQHLCPGPNEIDNAFAFNISGMTVHGRQDKSCFAKGITGQLTGNHADYIIVDDIEIEKNCETQTQRDRNFNRLLELTHVRNEPSRVIFLGTPQVIDSVYFRLQAECGYPVIRFPAVMPDVDNPDDVINVAEWILSLDLEPDAPTHPERFPQEVLDVRLGKVGPTNFALHYRLQTGLADKNKFPLKLRNLVVFDCDSFLFPERVVHGTHTLDNEVHSFGTRGDYVYKPMYLSDRLLPFTDKAVFIDPAGGGSDETVMVAAGTLNGYVVILDMITTVLEPNEEVMRMVVHLCQKHGITQIIVEDNFGAGMWRKLMLPIVTRMMAKVDVRGFKVPQTQKEIRICDALEPVSCNHRLVVNRRVIQDKETQTQYCRMQRKRGALAHDDRIDIIASVVRHWSNDIATDPQFNEKQSAEKAFAQTWNEFLNSGRGWNDGMNKASEFAKKNAKRPSILQQRRRF